MFHVTHVQFERVETHRCFYVNMFINKLQGREPSSWSHKQGIKEEGLNHRLPCFQNKAKQNKKPFLYFI